MDEKELTFSEQLFMFFIMIAVVAGVLWLGLLFGSAFISPWL